MFMTSTRIDRLELALIRLTDKFTEFISVESARQERDKHQLEINERILKHIETVDAEYKPTIDRVKKHHRWLDNFIGKVLLPLIIISVLSVIGFKLK